MQSFSRVRNHVLVPSLFGNSDVIQGSASSETGDELSVMLPRRKWETAAGEHAVVGTYLRWMQM